MHYATLVVIEKTDHIESAVESALAPTQDREWDWWQIGGRWTGCLDGYDPGKDPENLETCRQCNGTGHREDAEKFEAESPGWIEWSKGCNSCHGEGKSIKWPTDLKSHPGDVLLIENLTEEHLLKFCAVVLPDGTFFEEEHTTYTPWAQSKEEMFKVTQQELPPAEWLKQEYPGHLMVVLDIHN